MKKQKISITFTEIQNPSPPCEKLANHGIDLMLAEKVSSKSIDITDGMIRGVILSFMKCLLNAHYGQGICRVGNLAQRIIYRK